MKIAISSLIYNPLATKDVGYNPYKRPAINPTHFAPVIRRQIPLTKHAEIDWKIEKSTIKIASQ